MPLPKVLPFHDIPGTAVQMRCFWRRLDIRRPRKGEWYVSGAIPAAYRAPNDLSTEYLIVEPTHYARRVEAWERGEAVRLERRS